MLFEHLVKEIIDPPCLIDAGRFFIKVAENSQEIRAAQLLRFNVFNLEQGKGLASAQQTGLDHDEFDDYCLHLLVIEKATGNVIGTYRAQLGAVATTAKGFYSSREYDIEGLDAVSDECLELGRSCVASEFRTGGVVTLLWGGITELLHRGNLNLLLGCVSLELSDPAAAWALHRQFAASNCLSPLLKATPRPGFQLEPAPESAIQAFLDEPKRLNEYIPPLFKGYLRVGCKVCGEPAFDPEFGTIDFLILADRREIPERYFRYHRKAAGSI